MTSAPRIVITGLGVVAPGGVGVDALWETLSSGRSTIGELSEVPQGSIPMDFGAEIRDFEPKQFVRPRKALKVMCREIQTAFSSAQMAIEQAGIDFDQIDKQRIGTVYGGEMFYGPPEEMVDAARRGVEEGGVDRDAFTRAWGEAFPRELIPLWMLKYLPNMSACHIGIALGALGPNNTHVCDDVSSLASVIEAAATLQRGHADVMLAGGTGTRINSTRILYRGPVPYATRNGNVAKSCRPFAKGRTGLVGGEGAASVVMETETLASERSATPIASVAGWATRFRTPEKGRGSEEAIFDAAQAALESAGIEASQLAFIDSGACGDPEMDLAEGRAIARLAADTPVAAVKGTIGHAGAGCGAIELVAAARALAEQQVLPTIGAEERDPACGVRVVPMIEKVSGDYALKISANPQGNAAAIVLRRG